MKDPTFSLNLVSIGADGVNSIYSINIGVAGGG